MANPLTIPGRPLPIIIEESIEVPEWVVDLDSFRRWACSDVFPDRGRIAYFEGKIWIETSMEIVIHNKAKGKVCAVLENVISEDELGHLFVDRMRLTHPEVALSTEPDGLFASKDTLHRQRLQISNGALATELVGSPDMVLEVISTSSVQKDTVLLPRLYWMAGVQEYWLINPRNNNLRFDILKRGKKGFEPVKGRNGWLKSPVFGRSFRLGMTMNGFDLPVFTLEVKQD
jgi:Uma2 family endonuclease